MFFVQQMSQSQMILPSMHHNAPLLMQESLDGHVTAGQEPVKRKRGRPRKVPMQIPPAQEHAFLSAYSADSLQNNGVSAPMPGAIVAPMQQQMTPYVPPPPLVQTPISHSAVNMPSGDPATSSTSILPIDADITGASTMSTAMMASQQDDGKSSARSRTENADKQSKKKPPKTTRKVR